MSFDVVIVGAGVAGLSAAIRLKQLALAKERDLSVVVLEKGAAVGAHILSGALIDPVGLEQLIPDWRSKGAPLVTRVAEERLFHLTKNQSYRVPHAFIPPIIRHEGCYAGSLGALTRWLGEQAGELEVEIYPGFGAAEILYDEAGAVCGVATSDQGLDRMGQPTASHMRGMELKGKYTLFAEGARGFLSEQLIAHYGLDKGRDVSKYALGIKELWQISPDDHKNGLVTHMTGWPLPRGVRGGGFAYHYGDDLVSLGLVVHLDYADPRLSPFDLLQQFKTHPVLQLLLKGGKRIGYGARTLSEGGWQSVPRLTFPGGALIGCAAGLMNVPRLKGSHNAVLSAMMAAQACYEAISLGRHNDELAILQERFEASLIANELKTARNIKPLLERFGSLLGGGLGLLDLWSRHVFKTSPIGKLGHARLDRQKLRAGGAGPMAGKVALDQEMSFDKSSSVHLAGVFHEDDQPAHLVFTDPSRQLESYEAFGVEPAQFYCPAGVYELRRDEDERPFVHISASNCLHCKACDIKDPFDNIRWRLPLSGGPAYVDM